MSGAVAKRFWWLFCLFVVVILDKLVNVLFQDARTNGLSGLSSDGKIILKVEVC